MKQHLFKEVPFWYLFAVALIAAGLMVYYGFDDDIGSEVATVQETQEEDSIEALEREINRLQLDNESFEEEIEQLEAQIQELEAQVNQ